MGARDRGLPGADGGGYRGRARIPVPPLAAFVVGFGCVVGSALGVAAATPRPTPRSMLWLLPAFAVPVGLRIYEVAYGPVSASLSAVLVAGSLLAFGSLVGGMVGSRIEHPGHLLFVAVVSSLADTFSVAAPDGPSAAIASSEVALSLLAVSFPMLGTDQIAPLLGVGDLVFTSLYVSAARAHGLPMQRTWLALGAAFVVTMLVVIELELPIPALPFMGMAMLIAQPAARVPPARDRVRGFAALGAISALFIALLLRRFL